MASPFGVAIYPGRGQQARPNRGDVTRLLGLHSQPGRFPISAETTPLYEALRNEPGGRQWLPGRLCVTRPLCQRCDTVAVDDELTPSVSSGRREKFRGRRIQPCSQLGDRSRAQRH
jgi:hypothetical protein